MRSPLLCFLNPCNEIGMHKEEEYQEITAYIKPMVGEDQSNACMALRSLESRDKRKPF